MLPLLKHKLRSRSMTCSAQALFNTAKAPFPLLLFWSRRRTIPIVFVWTIAISTHSQLRLNFQYPLWMNSWMNSWSSLVLNLGSSSWISPNPDGPTRSAQNRIPDTSWPLRVLCDGIWSYWGACYLSGCNEQHSETPSQEMCVGVLRRYFGLQ